MLGAVLWAVQCCFEHADQIRLSPGSSRGQPLVGGEDYGGGCCAGGRSAGRGDCCPGAALDIGKAEVVCCVRVPHEGKPGRRLQEVETHFTMTSSLLAMSDYLRCLGVTRVVTEPMLRGKSRDIPKRLVWDAWLRVKKNGGAAGVDGVMAARSPKSAVADGAP